MTDNNEKIALLLKKLDDLSVKQEYFQKEIISLRKEITELSAQEIPVSVPPYFPEPTEQKGESRLDAKPEPTIIQSMPAGKEKFTPSPEQIPSQPVPSNIEKFIGENLISKVGIVITVIGVAIGAKYAIDHQLISPLTRIILGYLFGLGLFGFAVRLKQKYENFSAVLLSGSMAILYFITYAAYDFYGFLPRMLTFAMMVLFTAFTSLAAVHYNRQVIAHIGLVGAYAVPFLLSDGSGQVLILFTYMAIINAGILAVSLKKYWKSLYYSSFGLTWIIYAVWYFFEYNTSHFSLAFIFALLFFVIFYLTFLGYKLIRQGKYNAGDIILLLVNSFIFFGFGYSILDKNSTGEHLLGLFTLGNAVIHFAVATVIYRKKLADKNLLYLVTGLVLVFITIAIPIQLDGNWVTLLWAGEAVLLYWNGRSKNIPVYEKISFAVMLLAFSSIIEDWGSYRGYTAAYTIPVFNVHFLTSILFTAAFGMIVFLGRKRKEITGTARQVAFSGMVFYCAGAIFLFSLYYAFFLEIVSYFNQLYEESIYMVDDHTAFDYRILIYQKVWLINYTLLFLSLLSIVNLKIVKEKLLTYVNISLNFIAIVVFLTQGLYQLSELRVGYLESGVTGGSPIVIRYISYIFIAFMLLVSYQYSQSKILYSGRLKIFSELFLHLSILWIASSELIHWLDMMHSNQSYKLGLSILWGIYALVLIALGIWKKKKYLRIGAICLFGVTLFKLFFYDLSDLSTIAKTIVFISLGILLLTISFLYNKYKNVISDE